MQQATTNNGRKTLKLTIHGREVTLYFTEKPNPQIAVQVKQVLLETYLMTKK